MKDKIEEIIKEALQTKINLDYGICDNITGNPMKDYLLQLGKAGDKAADKIFALFKEEIIAKKDKIVTKLASYNLVMVTAQEIAQDIINIIIGEK